MDPYCKNPMAAMPTPPKPKYLPQWTPWMRGMIFLCALTQSIVLPPVNIIKHCSFRDTMGLNTTLNNDCISSKFATTDGNGRLVLNDKDGFFRAQMDSENGDLYILVLDQTNNRHVPYVTAPSPCDVPWTAFSPFPYWSLKQTQNVTAKLNRGILSVSTDGIQIVRGDGSKLWKGNKGKCNVPQLIMQADRNLVLYCDQDARGQPKNPKWNANVACHGKMTSTWCGNDGR